jgi:hypothetical protein
MSDPIKNIFLPGQNPNEPKDYEPFRHTEQLIRERCGPLSRFDYKKSAETLGYKNYTKFRRRVSEWLDLSGKIPLAFLDLISVSIAEIEAAVVLDVGEWQKQSGDLPTPKRFSVRLIPAVYKQESLPDDLTGAEATEFVSLYAKDTGFRCLISYGAIKSVYCEPDGRVWTAENAPMLTVNKKDVVFSIGRLGLAPGTEVGITKLG